MSRPQLTLVSDGLTLPPQANAPASDAPAPVPAAPAKPASAPLSAWSNVHAADAIRASSAQAQLAPPDSRRALKAFLKNPTAMTGLIFLALVVAAALAAPVLYPDDPLAMVARPLIWPGQDPDFPLGTDSLGRDVAAGLFHGARVSLMVGLAATAIGLAGGTLVGALAGYFGGRLDAALVRLIEIFQSIPSFILLIVLVAIAQPTMATITVAIGLVTWPTIARLARAEFRAIRAKEFVAAAKSLGYGHTRIILREILPNALPPLIVTASVMVASAILNESALSFMGMGDPNVVSWGSMIGAGRELLRTAWFLTALPGLVIVFTVLALNLIGDGLNDALNPRLSAER